MGIRLAKEDELQGLDLTGIISIIKCKQSILILYSTWRKLGNSSIPCC